MVFFIWLIHVDLVAQENQSCTALLAELMSKAQGAIDVYDWPLAIEFYQEAIEQGKKNGDLFCVSEGHRGLARIYANVGDFVRDLDDRYRDQLPDTVFFKEINLYEEAKREYQKAVNVALQTGNKRQVLKGELGYAIVEGQLRHYDRALKLFGQVESALKFEASQQNVGIHDELMYWVLNARAMVYYELGIIKKDSSNVIKSISDLRKTEALIKASEDHFGLMDVYQNMGRSFHWLAQYDSSLLYYRMSLQEVNVQLLATGEKLLLERSKGWYGLSKAFAGTDQPDSAYYYLKKYNESHDRLASSEQIKSVRQFLIFFDTERNQARIREQRFMIVISVVIILLLTMLALYVAYKRKTQKKISDQRIDDLLQQQEISSLQGVLEGQEEERQRIASDLHDKLGSILGMVKLHFSAVEGKIDILRDDNRKQYDKASQLLDEANVELRNISHDLMSGVLAKFGLIPALLDLKDKIEATGTVKVLVENHGVKNQLSRDQELQLYRIFQELMSNTLKHAKAKNIVIRLKMEGSQFSANYQDDGIGFDFDEVKKKVGMGLKNVEARVNKLRGEYEFLKSSQGVKIFLRIKLKTENGIL